MICCGPYWVSFFFNKVFINSIAIIITLFFLHLIITGLKQNL